MLKPVLMPSAATLKKYGLSDAQWGDIAEQQGWVCAVCKQLPKSNRLVIDHEHVRGWKKKKPEERRRYVRGLLCWRCNHYFVGRGITIERAKNVVLYLSNHMEKGTCRSSQ